jgi:hypothetical protein
MSRGPTTRDARPHSHTDDVSHLPMSLPVHHTIEDKNTHSRDSRRTLWAMEPASLKGASAVAHRRDPLNGAARPRSIVLERVISWILNGVVLCCSPAIGSTWELPSERHGTIQMTKLRVLWEVREHLLHSVHPREKCGDGITNARPHHRCPSPSPIESPLRQATSDSLIKGRQKPSARQKTPQDSRIRKHDSEASRIQHQPAQPGLHCPLPRPLWGG